MSLELQKLQCKIKQPQGAACRRSQVLSGAPRTARVYLSVPPTHTLQAPSKHQPRPGTAGLLKPPVSANCSAPADPISCLSLQRLHWRWSRQLCDNVNVTLRCLPALKFPGRGLRGNVSVCIALLLTPRSAWARALLAVISHFCPHVLSGVGLLLSY